MQLSVVRAAYSRASAQYIDLFDGDWDAHEVDAGFIRRHLHQVPGPVLDLGCGPGYWTAYLHSLQLQSTGIDVVGEFIDYARAAHPGPKFRLGSMTNVDATDNCSADILSWFSIIHMSPAEVSAVLTEFRRLLEPRGMLVLGFFDELVTFDHAVATAYRWPASELVKRLAEAGFVEVERMQRQVVERPERRYGAIATRAA